MKLTMILLAAWPAVSLQAQSHAKDSTVNRIVVVEQQYNPDIIDAQKVNVLPEVKEPTFTPNKVEYDGNIAPVAALPATAMAAYAGEEKQDPAKQGYLRLGYGNIGNVDVEGNYLFNPTSRDKLNFSLGLQGMDGKVYHPSSGEDWNSRFYRTKGGIDYIHQFNTVDFNIAGNAGLSNFNFNPDAKIDHQRFTSGDVRFGVKSTAQSLPMRFNLETGLYLYSRAHNVYTPDRGDKETKIRTKGDFNGDIAGDQQVGVAFEMNNLFYNNDEFENYTTLLLKPYYETAEEDAWKLHLGLNVDLASGYGKKIRISPDIRAEYTFSDNYVFYANATGGRILNDYRRLEQFNPYGELIGQNESSYEQLNAVFGFKMSPAEGFRMDLFGGFRQVNDDLYEMLDYAVGGKSFSWVYFDREKTKNFNAGLQISYAYKDIFSVMTEGQYYKWSADNEEALAFKPEYRFDLQLQARPVPALSINLGYEFVGRYAMNNLSSLGLGANYTLFDKVSIYARLSNLLNRKAAYYMNAPVPGINYVGGLIFSF
jgi:hypothetical protein